MTTPTTEKLIEEFEERFHNKMLPGESVTDMQAYNIDGFLRNAFEEVRASEREEVKGLLEGMKKENSDFPSLEAAKDYGKLDDLADYAHIDGQNYALDEAIAKLTN